MIRKKRESGKDSFELTPEKANKLNDDRAYTMAMAAYGLQTERRKGITQRKRPVSKDLVSQLTIRSMKRRSFLDC